MPVYIAANSNNPLTALTQCLELENIFMYYMTISVDFILQTSTHDENCFISLKFDSHSSEFQTNKNWKSDDQECIVFQAHLARCYFM